MTKEKINKRIKSIIGDAGRLELRVRAMDDIGPERFQEEHEKCHADAVRRAEWLTCRLYEATPVRKSEYLLRAAETLGIRLCDRDGIFRITLPGIIFGDNRGHPTEFLYDPLYSALDEYFRSHHHTQYRRCVVCIVQIFDRESRGCEGVLYCFDFQEEAIKQICGSQVDIQCIDFDAVVRLLWGSE